MKVLEIGEYFLVMQGSKIFEFRVKTGDGLDILVELERQYDGQEFEALKKKK